MEYVLWVFDSNNENGQPAVVKDSSTNPVTESSTISEAEIFEDSKVLPADAESIAQSRVSSNKIVKSGNPTTPPPPPF